MIRGLGAMEPYEMCFGMDFDVPVGFVFVWKCETNVFYSFGTFFETFRNELSQV